MQGENPIVHDILRERRADSWVTRTPVVHEWSTWPRLLIDTLLDLDDGHHPHLKNWAGS